MSSHHYPHSIYESLPYLYMGGGVLVVVSLDNAWGIFSGLLLLLAGAWVLWQRRTSRRTLHLSLVTSAREAAALAGNRESTRSLLVWSREYECGHVSIDSQHRRLFELGNAVLQGILDGKTKLDVELLLDELIKGVANHFRSEETLLEQANQMTPKHKDSHHILLARCNDMAARFHRDELKRGDLFNFVAQDLVSGHILREDLKFRAGNRGFSLESANLVDPGSR